VGAGGAATGTTAAEDCPIPPPAGSCEVGGLPAEVIKLAVGTTFVSTIGGALDKGAPRLTNIDRVSVPKATTGTDAATPLGGADAMPDGINLVYKAGTGITLPSTQDSTGTGGATHC